ncbi:unnamed protein product, partial [Ectocarpus sp. 12 AP-2014]
YLASGYSRAGDSCMWKWKGQQQSILLPMPYRLPHHIDKRHQTMVERRGSFIIFAVRLSRRLCIDSIVPDETRRRPFGNPVPHVTRCGYPWGQQQKGGHTS